MKERSFNSMNDRQHGPQASYVSTDSTASSGFGKYLAAFSHSSVSSTIFSMKEVQPFKGYILLTLHAAEHSRAITVEVAESGEFESYGPLRLITDISANLLQQLSVSQIKSTFDLEHRRNGPIIFAYAFTDESFPTDSRFSLIPSKRRPFALWLLNFCNARRHCYLSKSNSYVIR